MTQDQQLRLERGQKALLRLIEESAKGCAFRHIPSPPFQAPVLLAG